MRTLVVILVCACLCGAEVRLAVPDSLVPGALDRATLTLVNPPSWSTAVILPEIDGLVLRDLGSPSRQTIIINGEQRREESHIIALKATALGTYTIPPIRVMLNDGTSLSTEPTTLTVTAGDPTLVGEAVASVRFEPEHAIVGQRVRMIYRIAFAEDTLKIRSPGVTPPSDATIVETEDDREGTAWAADGRLWHTRTSSWVLTFDRPATVSAGGQQSYWPCRQVRDFFETKWVTTGPERRIAVKPGHLVISDIPADRPADWSGLIGEVAIEAALDRERIAAGEGVRLTLTLTGPQIDRAKPLQAPEVPGLRAYPRDSESPPGSRVFAWDVIPSKAGTYVIPPVTLSTFDPESGRFSRVSGKALTLEVIPGRSRGLDIVGAVGEPLPDAAAGVATALPPPLKRIALTPGPLAIAGTFLAALAMILGGFSLRRLLQRASGPHRGRALLRALAESRLDEAAALAHDLQGDDEGSVAALRRLRDTIDRARFGGTAVAVSEEDRRLLGRLP